MDASWFLAVSILVLVVVYCRGRADGRLAAERAHKELAAEIKAGEAVVAQLNAAAAQAPAPAPVSTAPWPEPPADFAAPVAVGGRFEYLGLDMVCTAHMIAMPGVGVVAGVRAEYVAADGQLHSTTFTGPELAALAAEVAREVHP